MTNPPDDPWADRPEQEKTQRYVPEREAMQNLADAFSEDILHAPGEHLLAEVAEDHGSADALARDFDRIAAQAELHYRKERRRRQLHAIFIAPFQFVGRRPVMIGVAAVLALFIANVAVLQMGGVYDFGHAISPHLNSTITPPQIALAPPPAPTPAPQGAPTLGNPAPAPVPVRRMEVSPAKPAEAPKENANAAAVQRLAELDARQRQVAEQLAAIQRERDQVLREQQARQRADAAPAQSGRAQTPVSKQAGGGAAPAPNGSKCENETATLTAIEGDLVKLQDFAKEAGCEDVRALARTKVAALEQTERTCTSEDLRRNFLLERAKATVDHTRLTDYKQQAGKLEQEATCAAQRPYLTETLVLIRVKIAQSDLKRLSCYTGEPDGVLNDATREAVKLFLSRIARPDNGGEVDEDLLTRLADRANARACTSAPDPRVAARVASQPPAAPRPALASRPAARPATPGAADQIQAYAPSANKSDGSLGRLTAFTAQYDGGDCFFLKTVAMGDTFASLEGMGSALAPFEKFDVAFKQLAGFEADIGVRLVTVPQCPAINFLRHVWGTNGSAPTFGLTATSQNLTGTITNRAGGPIELLLVSPTGTVQNLTSSLKGDDPKSFEMAVAPTGNQNSDPLLLIAVSASKALDALRPAGTIAAKDFFARLVSDATAAGVTLSATSQYVSPAKTPPVQLRSLPTGDRTAAPAASATEAR